MRRTVLLLIASLLLLLPACAPSDDFQGGRPISKEDLADISQELFTTTDTPRDTDATDTDGTETDAARESETQDTVDTEPEPDRIVYCLPTGSVYHLSLDCSHIAGKENVQETTVQEALENGRRLCKSCEKKKP